MLPMCPQFFKQNIYNIIEITSEHAYCTEIIKTKQRAYTETPYRQVINCRDMKLQNYMILINYLPLINCHHK